MDTPALSGIDLGASCCAARGVAWPRLTALRALRQDERARSVVLVQDAFTSHYETPLVLDVLDLMRALGFAPWLAPFRPNGKPLHVHGFLGAFERVAAANAAMLRDLADDGRRADRPRPLDDADLPRGIRRGARRAALPTVLLVQEWLARQPTAHGHRAASRRVPAAAALHRAHHRRGLRSATGRRSSPAIGLKLKVLPPAAAAWRAPIGHEAEHRATSERIYALSWAATSPSESRRLLATGYSCRSQVKRFDDRVLPHPAQALLAAMRERGRPTGGDAIRAAT